MARIDQNSTTARALRALGFALGVTLRALWGPSRRETEPAQTAQTGGPRLPSEGKQAPPGFIAPGFLWNFEAREYQGPVVLEKDPGADENPTPPAWLPWMN